MIFRFLLTALICQAGVCNVYWRCRYCVYIGVNLLIYCQNLMNSSVQEINLGKPLPDPKWCMIGIILPCTISLFYILFIPGKFRWENLPLQTMFDTILLSVFCRTSKSGYNGEVTFRGLMLGSLEKELGRNKAIMISSFVSIHFDSVEIQSLSDGIPLFWALMLARDRLALITCQTGSIWSSVVVHMLFNLLSGDSQIIHIDVEQIFPALWTYTVDSQSHLLVGIPGSRTIDYGIPAIIGFVVLIFIALFYMRKDNGEQCNYE